MVSFNTHVSEAQVTIGLITVLYNFNFEYLVTICECHTARSEIVLCSFISIQEDIMNKCRR
jgi:hypothetical protein